MDSLDNLDEVNALEFKYKVIESRRDQAMNQNQYSDEQVSDLL